MNNKYFKPLVLVAAFLVLGLVTTASYAYFSANVSGNTSAEETVITTGQMALLLTDGDAVSLGNAIPGSSVTKTFKVKNTGTVTTNYDVYLSEILNTFVDKNDLVYTLTSPTGCQTTTQTVVPSIVGNLSKIVSSCSINANQEHEYTLTILFKEDNTNQDDNKGKTFSAKISINGYNNYPGIADQIIDKKTNGATDLEYDGVDTLGEYGTPDNNLRYIGANPNNYVYFNCSTADPSLMNDSTCEKWRIIGVMNNVLDENGNSDSRVKIMRNESLGKYSWDSSASNFNNGDGINQWGESGTYEGADLMRGLNTYYLGNITGEIDNNWYCGENNSKNCSRIDIDTWEDIPYSTPTTTINSSSQNMIETVKWNLGSPAIDPGVYESSDLNVLQFYNFERSNTSNNTLITDNIYRTSIWQGKIGIIYMSDFGYSTGSSVIENDYPFNSHMWMQNAFDEGGTIGESTDTWTMTTCSDFNSCVYSYTSGGYAVEQTSTSYPNDIYPTLYLKNTVLIDSGEGTNANPYKLAI